MPTYDATTLVMLALRLFRSSSVCGSGLEGHSIQAIFWLLTLNGTRVLTRVRLMNAFLGEASWAASIRSDSGFCSQKGRMPTYQLGPYSAGGAVLDVCTNRARAPNGRLWKTS